MQRSASSSKRSLSTQSGRRRALRRDTRPTSTLGVRTWQDRAHRSRLPQPLTHRLQRSSGLDRRHLVVLGKGNKERSPAAATSRARRAARRTGCRAAGRCSPCTTTSAGAHQPPDHPGAGQRGVRDPLPHRSDATAGVARRFVLTDAVGAEHSTQVILDTRTSPRNTGPSTPARPQGQWPRRPPPSRNCRQHDPPSTAADESRSPRFQRPGYRVGK